MFVGKLEMASLCIEQHAGIACSKTAFKNVKAALQVCG